MRQAAAGALGQIRDARAVKPLIAALRDDYWAVRRAAAEALGQIGDAPAVEPLIAALKDQDRAVRKAAAKVLVDIYRSGKLEPKKRSPVLAQRSAITELGVAFPD